jgi:hypothetical protein
MEMKALNRCEVLGLIPEINRQSRSVRRRHHHDSFGVEELYRSAVEESCRLAVEVRAGGGGKDLSNPRCHTRETKIPRLRSAPLEGEVGPQCSRSNIGHPAEGRVSR